MDTLEKVNINDSLLNELLTSYERNPTPIEVNFREMVPSLNSPDRFTHLIHTYPAKLLPHIPNFFLNNSFLSKPGDTVLDPFCGSGTVLLESLLAGRSAYGVDANPLARLISTVKTTHFKKQKLKTIALELSSNIDVVKTAKVPDVVNVDYWFLPHIKNQLGIILTAINSIEDTKYRDFFLVCFSNCVKKVSLADPRVSVPVKIKNERFPDEHPFKIQNDKTLQTLESLNVKTKFFSIVDENIKRVSELNSVLKNQVSASIISNNARNIISPVELDLFPGCNPESVDLIITSPPYAGAQKYIRSSSLNLGWTQLAGSSELRLLDGLSIGRENYRKNEFAILRETGVTDADKILQEIFKINPLRAHIAGNYLIEMDIALRQSTLALKKGGYFVLVIANNEVCKMEFKTQEYLQSIAEKHGLKIICRLIDDIKSYGLMTKRNKTASVITREWILIFEKK